MKSAFPYLRVILFLILSFFLLEWIVESGDQWAIAKYPIIWGVLALIAFFAIALEIIHGGIKRTMIETMEPEAKKRFLAEEEGGLMEWYQKMMASKPIESEDEIVLDHEYDGIRELDNVLPPWWKYLFYATIVFAVIYLFRYEVFNGPSQIDELENALVKAEAQIAEYRKNNKDLINVDNVELLTEEADLAAGKQIFVENCAACHKESGAGGIGPNLTDEYWILGGGIKNIFNTVSEGGRPGKGMIPWKTELNALEMAQVSSYIITLEGTNPPDGKEPEGEKWDPESDS